MKMRVRFEMDGAEVAACQAALRAQIVTSQGWLNNERGAPVTAREAVHTACDSDRRLLARLDAWVADLEASAGFNRDDVVAQIEAQ